MKKDKLLENFTRGRIYGHIETHPGIHYSELLRDLNLGNGNLAYHLKTLERERMIRSVREGQMRLFFAKNGKPSGRRYDPLVRKAEHRVSGTRQAVMSLISSTPGLTETEIAQWLTLSKQTVHYHIRDMESKGTIRVEREGGNARCFFRFKEGNGSNGGMPDGRASRGKSGGIGGKNGGSRGKGRGSNSATISDVKGAAVKNNDEFKPT